jgi:hypothetical protein
MWRAHRKPRILVAAASIATLLSICSSKIEAQSQRQPCIHLLNQPVLAVSRTTGEGTTELLLHNRANRSVELFLTAKSPSPTTATVEFSVDKSAPPAQVLRITVPAHEPLRVTMTLRDEWADKDYDWTLLNHFGTEEIGLVRTIHLPASLKLEPEELNLGLIDGIPTRIVVRNNDPKPYNVKWKLVNSRFAICEGSAPLTLKQNSATALVCTPNLGWDQLQYNMGYHSFSLRSLAYVVKPNRASPGYRLVLAPADGSGPEEMIRPLAAFDGRGSLNYITRQWSEGGKAIVVVILLCCGGVVSLLLSNYFPNKVTRLNLRERLLELAKRTANLSTRIDSRLAVAVRLERSRLEELIKKRSPSLPDFQEIAKQVSEALDVLEQKVKLAEKMDDALGDLEQCTTIAPPTKVEEIRNLLQRVATRLSRPEVQQGGATLDQAAGDIKSAVDAVGGLSLRDADLQQRLQQRRDAAQARLKALEPTAAYKGFVFSVQTLVDALSASGWSVTELDYLVHKAEIIVGYLELRNGYASQEATETRLEGGTVARRERPIDRLLERTPMLIERLHVKSCEALRSAHLLLYEMRDDIYPERIKDAIRESATSSMKGELDIEFDPQVVYENAPVDLSVRCYDPVLETSAAREEFVVRWDFDDGLHGEGWSTSHYFLPRKSKPWPWQRVQGSLISESKSSSSNREFHVSVQFVDRSGSFLMLDQSNPAALSKQLTLHESQLLKSTERTRVESIQLAVALGVAALGLLSGAETQIDKMDLIPGLIAIFLLGFGADSMKRLLASGQPKS